MQNAEITGGGIPGWVTALNVSLRTADPGFRDAYTPYWEKMGEIIAQNQISNGGPIIAVQIENGESSSGFNLTSSEYYLNSAGDIDTTYIEQLESSMRSSGVAVPFFFNDVSSDPDAQSWLTTSRQVKKAVWSLVLEQWTYVSRRHPLFGAADTHKMVLIHIPSPRTLPTRPSGPTKLTTPTDLSSRTPVAG